MYDHITDPITRSIAEMSHDMGRMSAMTGDRFQQQLRDAYEKGRTEAYESYRAEIVRVMDCYQANLQRMVNKIEYLAMNCTAAASVEFARLCREFDNQTNN